MDENEVETPNALPKSAPIIVGIGASAGGLEALKDLFVTMPADSGLVFVVIQHLDPARSSHMAELLGRYTSMKVVEATDGIATQPNAVYTIPPNTYIGLRNGHLVLSQPVKRGGMRMPIDYFLRSIAETAHERSIGIVLSGSGADGALGVRAIRGAGGMVMVQDPATAQFGDMPRAAIETGLVDFILPPEEMPAALISYVRQTYGLPGGEGPIEVATDESPGVLSAILHQLISRADLDMRQYKRSTILRRIRRRMGLRQVEQLSDYLRILRDDQDEVDKLAKDMLIGVTSFFREPEAFETLREAAIAPLVAHKRENDPIRVWVPGCATGEEAYSIAMLLMEELWAAHRPNPVQIFATDINDDALRAARLGIYPENIANDVSPERLERFFTHKGSAYHINTQLREMIVFSMQNLLSDPPFSRLDLVVCRNVLIYLVSEAQRKIISLFGFALSQGGYLFLGKSEGIADHNDLFEPISKTWRVYRRSPSSYPLTEFPVVTGKARIPAGVEAPTPAHRAMDLAALNQQVLLKHYDAAVVLVDEQANIVHFFGNTSRYLGHPTGEANLNLLNMAPESIAIKLRGALHHAIREGESVEIPRVLFPQGDKTGLMNLTVMPVIERRTGMGLYAVIFEETHEAGAVLPPPADEATYRDSDLLIRQLQTELRMSQDDLRVVVEQYETSNEELKAANEEMMSMNEELQSSNEELETSKEELQSVNEELVTVNSQLSDKIDELSEVNNDLANLFAATDIATLFLDRELHIKRFTPPATRLLNLIPADVGRPIGDITQRFEGEGLAKDAARVLRELTPAEREVRVAQDIWYTLRITPYRTLDDRIDGLVITFSDVTRLKRIERDLQDTRVLAENTIETIRQPLLVLDSDLRVALANRAFCDLFQVNSEETTNRLLYTLGNGQWDIPALRRLLEEILPHNTRVEDFEVEHAFPRLGRRIMRLDARRIAQEDEHPARILLAIEDVTEQRQREQTMQRLTEQVQAINRDLEALGRSLTHDLRAPLRTLVNASKSLRTHAAERLDARSREQVERIGASARQMEGLLDNLLRLLRVARAEPRARTVDLTALTRQVAEELRQREPERAIEFSVQDGLSVQGDPQLLRLALESLLDNARRFTRDRPQATINVGSSDQDGVTTFFVRDNGAGFDLPQGEGLLEALRHAPLGDGQEDLSLTLATVESIIERHGGRLWAESQPGQGTTIYFTLPSAE